MIRPFGILLAFDAVLGISALAVRIGDRDLFVSPPDVVAEGFVREVILERYEEARAFLADPESATEKDLRELRERLVRIVGPDPNDFETEVEAKDQGKARVKVTVTSNERSDDVSFDLKFDSEWKILPASAGEGPQTSRSVLCCPSPSVELGEGARRAGEGPSRSHPERR